MVDKTPIQPCCEAWTVAHDSGSDSEGYAALAYVDGNGRIQIGDASSLPPVRFCPWCGARKLGAPTTEDQRKYDDLPLGARFRYVGHADYGVWVKLENGGTGVIARWGKEVGRLQSICSLCETEAERETFIVEVVE